MGVSLLRRAMSLATVFVLAAAGAAIADQFESDSDALTADQQNNAVIVSLAPGGSEEISVGAFITSTGGANSDHVAFPVSTSVSLVNPNGVLSDLTPTSGSISGYGIANELKASVTVTAPTGVCGTVGFGGNKVVFASSAADLNPNEQQIEITAKVTGPACQQGTTNSAPTVGSIVGADTAAEGDTGSYSVTATDPDVSDTLTYSWSVPSGNATLSGPTDASSVSVVFDDGPSAVDLQVVVDDGQTGHAVTRNLAIDETNVAPSVAAPTFAPTAIDCRTSVALTGLSFSDPGLGDDPWTVNIDWGDASADTNFDTSSQGGQTDRSHTYTTPGSYAASVDVTDKDDDAGSNSTATSLVVRQVYRVDFLPPFDDSTPSGLIVNTMKSGRTVPVKATIFDVCANSYVTSPSAVTIGLLNTSLSSSNSDAVETYADAGAANANSSAFRWTTDTSIVGGGFWIYNLDSRNAVNGSPMTVNHVYRVNIYVGTALATGTDWALLKAVK
jgi:hypothetical protein